MGCIHQSNWGKEISRTVNPRLTLSNNPPPSNKSTPPIEQFFCTHRRIEAPPHQFMFTYFFYMKIGCRSTPPPLEGPKLNKSPELYSRVYSIYKIKFTRLEFNRVYIFIYLYRISSNYPPLSRKPPPQKSTPPLL